MVLFSGLTSWGTDIDFMGIRVANGMDFYRDGECAHTRTTNDTFKPELGRVAITFRRRCSTYGEELPSRGWMGCVGRIDRLSQNTGLNPLVLHSRRRVGASSVFVFVSYLFCFFPFFFSSS